MSKGIFISSSDKNQINVGKFADETLLDKDNLQKWLFSQIMVFVFRDFRVSLYFLFSFGWPLLERASPDFTAYFPCR